MILKTKIQISDIFRMYAPVYYKNPIANAAAVAKSQKGQPQQEIIRKPIVAKTCYDALKPEEEKDEYLLSSLDLIKNLNFQHNGCRAVINSLIKNQNDDEYIPTFVNALQTRYSKRDTEKEPLTSSDVGRVIGQIALVKKHRENRIKKILNY